jgi:hypothetical protein
MQIRRSDCSHASTSVERQGTRGFDRIEAARALMPYYPRLIAMLQAAPTRPNSAGEIFLTEAEAAVLRAADFATARAGWWAVRLPSWTVRQHNRQSCSKSASP